MVFRCELKTIETGFYWILELYLNSLYRSTSTLKLFFTTQVFSSLFFNTFGNLSILSIFRINIFHHLFYFSNKITVVTFFFIFLYFIKLTHSSSLRLALFEIIPLYMLRLRVGSIRRRTKASIRLLFRVKKMNSLFLFLMLFFWWWIRNRVLIDWFYFSKRWMIGWDYYFFLFLLLWYWFGKGCMLHKGISRLLWNIKIKIS